MMSKKITKSGKTFFQNTMRMVNFSNRLKEENLMWRKYAKIKKRKLDESDEDDSDDQLAYENKYFREKDDSMNSMKMDISMHEANNLSNLKHLNESDVKLRKGTPSKSSRKKTPTKKKIKKSIESSKKKSRENDDETTTDSSRSSSSSSCCSDDDECMVDNSFSSIDDRLLKTPKSSKTAYEKKIKLREKELNKLKKQMDKLNGKKDKKSKKKKKKSKKHKKHEK